MKKAFTTVSALGLLAAISPAVVTVYTDLSLFNTDAGNPGIAVDFDSVTPGTDIGATSLGGVTFTQTGAPLIVVDASSTFPTGEGNGVDHRLYPTSGRNVLSPGGLELPTEGPNQVDNVTFSFSSPIRAFGFDILFQSFDVSTFTSISVYAGNTALWTGSAPQGVLGAGAPHDEKFWGVVSTDSDITSIVVTETDNGQGNPDSNIGFDTIRYAPVPEPASIAALGLGLVGLVRRQRSRSARK